jgi:hypothetical protein
LKGRDHSGDLGIGGKIIKVKKVKFSLCLTKHHAMKAYRGSGSIAPLILLPRH